MSYCFHNIASPSFTFCSYHRSTFSNSSCSFTQSSSTAYKWSFETLFISFLPYYCNLCKKRYTFFKNDEIIQKFLNSKQEIDNALFSRANHLDKLSSRIVPTPRPSCHLQNYAYISTKLQLHLNLSKIC